MDQQQQVAYIFDKHADWYVERFMDVSLYTESLDHFLNRLSDEAVKVVDLGCGPGNVTRYLLSKRPYLQITGVDLAPAMIEQAKKHNENADFMLSDWKLALEKFTDLSGITAAFLLPYLSEEEVKDLFSLAAASLQPDGVIFISTMEGEYCVSGLKTNSSGDKVNMYYYTESQLCGLLEHEGFSVCRIDRKTYVYNDAEVTDLIVLAVKTVS